MEELNRFLRGHRVLSVQKPLVGNDSAAYWAIGVDHIESVAGSTSGAAFGAWRLKVIKSPGPGKTRLRSRPVPPPGRRQTPKAGPGLVAAGGFPQANAPDRRFPPPSIIYSLI